MRKRDLRRCAQFVLERHGYEVETVTSAGVLPGARLRARMGAAERTIAVRTSLDREVGLTRQPDGTWTTISKVDEVLIVVPANDPPDAAEVFAFAPAVLIEAFNAVLAARTEDKGELACKVPIFVSLDTPVRGTFDPVAVGLREKAEWRTVVPLASVREREGTDRGSTMALLERVKREYADLQGVDVGCVSVEFRIKG
jgi:hypothetical protein